MAVVNVTPGDGLRMFPANTVRGALHIYCIGPAEAKYVLQIGQDEQEAFELAPGHTNRHEINGQSFIVRDYGPSTIQLLWSDNAELSEVSEAGSAEDAAAFDARHGG
ncbi:MAG: hypothetical protein AAGP08_19550 [Pseudomonadota bacterium]